MQNSWQQAKHVKLYSDLRRDFFNFCFLFFCFCSTPTRNSLWEWQRQTWLWQQTQTEATDIGFPVVRLQKLPAVIHSNGHSDTQRTSRQVNTTRNGWWWGCGDNEAGIKWRNASESMGGSCSCEWIVIWRARTGVAGAMLCYIIRFMAGHVLSAMDC